jgi:Protein of unknown function (DUF3489)
MLSQSIPLKARAERRHNRDDHDFHRLQPPLVRGFFAAVVRKKLALRLESEKTDGGRVYRIVARKTSAAADPLLRMAGRDLPAKRVSESTHSE